MVRNITIAEDKTDGGEDATEIIVQEEDGSFFVTQQLGMSVACVGMSREQAKKVIDALNRLLEPVS